MKATGMLTFMRQPNGALIWKWTGGRRIAITGQLLREIVGSERAAARVIEIEGIRLRRITVSIDHPGAMTDSYIYMREGLLARLVHWYATKAADYIVPLYLWESKWIWRRKVEGGALINRKSPAGLLALPMTW